jgi:hypothetical protein
MACWHGSLAILSEPIRVVVVGILDPSGVQGRGNDGRPFSRNLLFTQDG